MTTKYVFVTTEFVANSIEKKFWVLSRQNLLLSLLQQNLGFVTIEFVANSVATKSGFGHDIVCC